MCFVLSWMKQYVGKFCLDWLYVKVSSVLSDNHESELCLEWLNVSGHPLFLESSLLSIGWPDPTHDLREIEYKLKASVLIKQKYICID